MKKLVVHVVLVLMVCSLILVMAAAAAPNGKIAFSSNYYNSHWDILTVNADGTGLTQLTTTAGYDEREPAWSPDGTKIAFIRSGYPNGIHVVNADGTGLTFLHGGGEPSWSPDGTKIAFSTGSTRQIYVMNDDGTGVTDLSNNQFDDSYPSWSPDGTKIAFDSARSSGDTGIYVMDVDGTGVTEITHSVYNCWHPSWSPDGTKIAFSSRRSYGVLPGENKDIYVINADGTGETRLTDNAMEDDEPAWSPDGTKIAFTSYRDGVGVIYVMNAGGTGQTVLANTPNTDLEPAWGTAPVTPTITVVSPNGNQTWQPGSAHTITWEQTGLSDTNVKILLMKDYGFNVAATIADPVSATSGSFTWTVPSTLASGTDYWVKIVSLRYPDVQGDMWSGWITIPGTSTGTIAVTSPNGGEWWWSGTTQIIRWTYTGDPGPTVKIALKHRFFEDYSVTQSTSSGSNGQGSFEWPIPRVNQVDYKIEITSNSDPSIVDQSDNYFWLPLSSTASITLNNPTTPTVFRQGTPLRIEWRYTGNPGSAVNIELLKGSGVDRVINASTPLGSDGQGTYTWNIPIDQPVGTDYKMRLTSTTNAAYNCTSDAFFEIEAWNGMHVITPDGGESWAAGSPHLINWEYKNTGPALNVHISLFKGGVMNQIINASTPIGSSGTGSYIWTIPPTQTPGGDYTIQIYSTPGGYMDTSDAPFTITVTPAPALASTKIGVYKDGMWYLDLSGNGAWDNGIDSAYNFGAPSWTSIVGDWNATGKSYIGVTNGQQWYLDWNGNGAWDVGTDKAYSFGAPGWTNVTGDWNHDGKTEIGVTNGQQWYLDTNGNGAWDTGIDNAYSFGATGWTPVVGDWNPAVAGTKIGVYKDGVWYLDWNGNGAWDASIDKTYSFGAPGWTPLIGDWYTTANSYIGVTNGQQWYLDWNGNGVWDGTDRAYSFGAPGWTPLVGDWNGDGKTKIGVTNSQQWYLDTNGNGAWDNGVDYAYSFGAPGWTPIVGKWN